MTNKKQNNKRTKVLKVVTGIALIIALIIAVACDIQDNAQAKATEFESLPLKTQSQIKHTQKTITHVTAKAINNKEVVNIKNSADVITDNKADFKKGKTYQLTFTGDWLTEIKEVK